MRRTLRILAETIALWVTPALLLLPVAVIWARSQMSLGALWWTENYVGVWTTTALLTAGGWVLTLRFLKPDPGRFFNYVITSIWLSLMLGVYVTMALGPGLPEEDHGTDFLYEVKDPTLLFTGGPIVAHTADFRTEFYGNFTSFGLKPGAEEAHVAGCDLIERDRARLQRGMSSNGWDMAQGEPHFTVIRVKQYWTPSEALLHGHFLCECIFEQYGLPKPLSRTGARGLWNGLAGTFWGLVRLLTVLLPLLLFLLIYAVVRRRSFGDFLRES